MTTPTVTPPTSDPEITSDDRLWVVLSFLFTPLFPLITLFMEDKKNRSFIKYHNIPILILGGVEAIISIALSFIPVVNCLGGLLWIINIIYAVKANGGTKIDIPVITDFSKGQGWS